MNNLEVVEFTQDNRSFEVKKQADGIIDMFKREVVVIVPFGNYNQPQELGRYKNLDVATNIVSSLTGLPEYKMFYLDTGEEVTIH